jgi:hypothetical protein
MRKNKEKFREFKYLMQPFYYVHILFFRSVLHL